MKWLFRNQDFQIFGPNKTNMSNFHPLEVVCRGSETQLQVGENYICLFSSLRANVGPSSEMMVQH